MVALARRLRRVLHDEVTRMSVPDPRQVARIYQGARGRITALVDELDDAGLNTCVAGDITCHEHDIRGALGRPGARDSDAVRYSSDRLLANLRSPVPLWVKVEDAEYRSGPEEGAELLLHTQHDSKPCAGGRVGAAGPSSRRWIGPMTQRRCWIICTCSGLPRPMSSNEARSRDER
jgi:hypothetical protein